MAYKAYIFDLDGTLVDTLGSISYFANRALEKYGFQPIDREKYRYLVGNGAKKLVWRMLRENGSERQEDFDRVLPYYNQSYDDAPTYLAEPYPGIRELLSDLKRSGIRLGVLSNKPHSTTCQIIDALFEKGTFDIVYGQREGVPLKPDPTALLEMLRQLGAAPEECVYCGDTATDMQTGKAAGTFTVGVLWGFRDREELLKNHADAIVSSAGELFGFLAGQGAGTGGEE